MSSVETWRLGKRDSIGDKWSVSLDSSTYAEESGGYIWTCAGICRPNPPLKAVVLGNCGDEDRSLLWRILPLEVLLGSDGL